LAYVRVAMTGRKRSGPLEIVVRSPEAPKARVVGRIRRLLPLDAAAMRRDAADTNCALDCIPTNFRLPV